MSDASSVLAMLSTPPAHKERRRLRKKSRPPHVDEIVFELQERGQSRLPSSSPIPSSTPERDAPSPPRTCILAPIEEVATSFSHWLCQEMGCAEDAQ
jgi:hypothetical protein